MYVTEKENYNELTSLKENIFDLIFETRKWWRSVETEVNDDENLTFYEICVRIGDSWFDPKCIAILDMLYKTMEFDYSLGL